MSVWTSGSGPVVADGSDEDEALPLGDERVHHAAREHAVAHRAFDRAGLADGVDRPDPVLVTVLVTGRGRCCRGWHRRARSRCRARPPRCRRRGRRPSRPAREPPWPVRRPRGRRRGRPPTATGCPRPVPAASRRPPGAPAPSAGAPDRGPRRTGGSPRPRGSELGTLTWMPAAPTTMRMPRATSDIGHRPHPRVACGRLLDDQAAVHLGVVHVVPAASQAHPRLEVGGGVEPVGQHAVLLGGRDRGVAVGELVDATRLQAHEEALERLVVGGLDRDAGAARVVGLVADVELLDDEVAAVLADVVEDARQDAAVHQVSRDLDRLPCPHPADPTPARGSRDRRQDAFLDHEKGLDA